MLSWRGILIHHRRWDFVRAYVPNFETLDLGESLALVAFYLGF